MSLSDKEKIVAIMRELCSFAFLATVDGDQPQVRPVSPIVEEDMGIWVATFVNSRKVKQISENPKVCLAFVQHPSGDKAATVTGEAEIREDLEEKKRVWKIAPYDLSQHFKNPEAEEYCLLRIKPNRIEWWENWDGGRKVYVP